MNRDLDPAPRWFVALCVVVMAAGLGLIFGALILGCLWFARH